MSSIAEVIEGWSNRDVTDWLRGIDESVLPVVHFFFNAQISGKQLLMMNRDDLEILGITQVGVRELIVQALKLLGNLCYNTDSENLQSIALSLSVEARNVSNSLERIYHSGSADRISIGHLNRLLTSISNLTDEAKCLVSWLNRPPFSELRAYGDTRRSLLQLVTDIVRMGTVQNILKVISSLEAKCTRIVDLCERIVQESFDPLITQTAYIDRAVLKRKSITDDLVDVQGFHIESNFCGVHIVSAINAESPAYFCRKLDEGDELIQIGGQMVVGWQLARLVKVLRSIKSKEVELLVKKRPKDIYQLGKGNQTPRSRLRPPPTPYSAAPFDSHHKSKVPSAVHFQQDFTTHSVLDEDSERGSGVKLRRRSSSIGNLQSPIERNFNILSGFDSKTGSKCSTPTSKTSTPTSPYFPIIKIDSPMESGPPGTSSRIRRTTVSGGSPVFRRLSLNTPIETAAPRRQTDWFQADIQRPITQNDAFKFGALHERPEAPKVFGHMFSHHRISYDGNQLIVPKKFSLSSTSSSDSAELLSAGCDDLSSPGIINLQPPPKSRKQTGNTSSSGQTERTSCGSKMSGSDVKNSATPGTPNAQIAVADEDDEVFDITVKVRSSENPVSPLQALSEDNLEDFSQIEVINQSDLEKILVGTGDTNEWFDPRHKSIVAANDNSPININSSEDTISQKSDSVIQSLSSFEWPVTPASTIPPNLISKLPQISQEKLRRFFGEVESPTTSRPSSPLVSGRSTPLGTPSTGRKLKVVKNSESSHFTPIKDLQFLFHHKRPTGGVEPVSSPFHKTSAVELQHSNDLTNVKGTLQLSSSSFTAADVCMKSKGQQYQQSSSTSGLSFRSFIPCANLCDVIHQGWLYRAQRKDPKYIGRSPADKWVKSWAVLKQCHLYLYKSPAAESAQGIIRLVGFIACDVDVGHEYKTSRKNVFKLEMKNFGTPTSFYFSCDKHADMITWLNHLGLAIISYEGREDVSAVDDTPYCFNEETNRDHLSMSQWYVPPTASTLPRIKPTPISAREPLNLGESSVTVAPVEQNLPPKSGSNVVGGGLRKTSLRRFKKRSVEDDGQQIELNIDKNANKTSFFGSCRPGSFKRQNSSE